MISKKKKPNFSLNTTSTADISFMLLTFFLVTSSMDVDKGIIRQLPPPDNPQQTVPIQMEADNILAIELHNDGTCTIDGQSVGADNMSQRVADFISKRGKNHIISIVSSPLSEYGQYFKLQEQLYKAYDAARDKASMAKYKRPYSKLSDQQREQIRQDIPQRMVENDD